MPIEPTMFDTLSIEPPEYHAGAQITPPVDLAAATHAYRDAIPTIMGAVRV